MTRRRTCPTSKHKVSPMIRLSSVRRRMSSAREWLRDERGIAAAEFSILAPILIGLYFGLAEISRALQTQRHIHHSASVVGDLVTQVSAVDEDDMADLFAAALRVSQANNNSELVLRLTSYEKDDDDNVNIVGQAIYNSGLEDLLLDDDAENLGAEFLNNASGTVIASVAYRYYPLGLSDVEEMMETDPNGKGLFKPVVVMRKKFPLKSRAENVLIGGGAGSKLDCAGSASSVVCTSVSAGSDDDDYDDDD